LLCCGVMGSAMPALGQAASGSAQIVEDARGDYYNLAREGLKVDWRGGPKTITMPKLPDLRTGGGFSLDLWFQVTELSPGQVILDTRDSAGKGIALTTSDRFTMQLTLNDGHKTSFWDSDPGTHPGTLSIGRMQHVAVTVDGGPKIITFVVNGVLNDGGAVRQYGWGRFDPELSDVDGRMEVSLAPRLFGELKSFRVYDRYLRTSEAVANFRAG